MKLNNDSSISRYDSEINMPADRSNAFAQLVDEITDGDAETFELVN
jgi:hypothetical protein